MQFELTREFVEDLRQIIDSNNNNRALELMNELHAADIAEIFKELSIEESRYLFLLLEGEKGADVIAELDFDDRIKILKAIPSNFIAENIIEFMDSDDAADILGDLPEATKEEILSHVKDIEQAGDIVDLLSYDEDSAGGLMGKELISVNENWDISSCLEKIREEAKDIDEFYMLYVVDDDKIFKGTVSLKEILINIPKTLISTICEYDVVCVKTETKKDEVVNIMDKYDLVSLPVVDSINRLVGRITIDDIVDVIREEAEKDYQMASGITEDIEPSDKFWASARARIPWLFIGLLGGILGSQVISYYEIDLGLYPEMAFFIPLIMSMAGNVGIQSSAIIVQGLANNALRDDDTVRQLKKEFVVGLFNGLIFATLIFVYNLFMSDGYALTLSVSIALFTVIVFATLFGTFVPLLLNRYKIDPALATGPFITTINDIIGIFVYLFIGRLMFGIL